MNHQPLISSHHTDCRPRLHRRPSDHRLLSGRRSRIIRAVFVFVIILFTMTISDPARAASVPMKDILPAKDFARDWNVDGKVELFDKDTLFNHINGEAELYFPYGFEFLVSANYVHKKNPDLSLTVDVYKMGSVLDAFGIYANYRKPTNAWVSVGAEGFASPSQLLFYQDRYFIKLQVTSDTSLPQETLLACARAVSRNLPAGSGPPKELEALQIPALVPKSERYLAKSLLGYAFFRKGMIADAGIQDEKMQIFVVAEDTPAAARNTFNQYHAYLKAEAQNIQLTEHAGQALIVAVDPLYGGVRVEQSGRYVIGTVRVKNNTVAERILEQLRRRIRTQAGD